MSQPTTRKTSMGRRKGPSDALALLGLAHRAGAVARGADATRKTIRKGKARLVVMAEDASPAQLAKILKTMEQRSFPRGYVPSRAELGAALGAGPLSAVAVTNGSFASQISRALQSVDEPLVEPRSK